MMTTRIATFGTSNGATAIKSREPLGMDAIRQYAPSVFATTKHAQRSDRYTHIPTSDIVEHLMQSGYGVFAVQQGGSRDEEKRGFTKHLIRFRNLNEQVQVGGTHNEIVLLNSHDGTSAYRLMAGVFRLICSNGMIVCQSCVEDIRIKHSGDILGEVSEGVQRIRIQLPTVSGAIADMQSVELTPNEQSIFARAALTAKYGEEVPAIQPEAILSPRRQEDRKPDLWTVLNKTQENIVLGGQRYTAETATPTGQIRRSRRTTRPVNGVDGNTNVNRALWQLAEEMKKLKTAS